MGKGFEFDNSPKTGKQMANHHMKGCSAPLILREMQMNGPLKYEFTLTRRAIIRKTISFGKNVKKLEISYIARGNIKRGSQFGNQLVSFLNTKHQVNI